MSEPRNAATILTDLARLAAFKELVMDRDRALRAELGRHAQQVIDLTGAAFNAKVTGIAHGYITTPAQIPQITDPVAFAAYLRATFGDGAVQTVGTLDRSQVEKAAAENPDLRALLTEAGCYVQREVWHESAPLDAAERCVTGEDGTLFDRTSGEAVGLRMVAVSEPTLTVRTEKAYRDQAKAQIAATFVELAGKPVLHLVEGGE